MHDRNADAGGTSGHRWLWPIGALCGALSAEVALVHLGRTYGSTDQERTRQLPGDGIVAEPKVVTNHAVTIDAPRECVWPWLVQMGWERGGWYTARWVDRLLFPANGPSADRIVPDLQHLRVGDFIPDGPPDAQCGLIVEVLEPNEALVLHSTTHLPRSWRAKARADWSWAFVLTAVDGGRRTRFLFRSRWTTAPWWLTAATWLGLVPADFVMARDMLRGIKHRAERLARVRTGRSERVAAGNLSTFAPISGGDAADGTNGRRAVRFGGKLMVGGGRSARLGNGRQFGDLDPGRSATGRRSP